MVGVIIVPGPLAGRIRDQQGCGGSVEDDMVDVFLEVRVALVIDVRGQQIQRG